MFKIRPLADRVVIKPMERETKKGSIIIPDMATQRPQQGEIMAVGPGRIVDDGSCIKPRLQEGDIVLHGRHSGTEINVVDNEYLIMREGDILAVVGRA